VKPARPRSIVALAEEESTRARKERRAFWSTWGWVLGAALQAFGWWTYRLGHWAEGSRWILGGLLAWALWGGAGRFFRGSFLSALGALGVALASGIPLVLHRAQTFQWGSDPAFYLAVLHGEIPPPFANPLAVLTAQAILPFLKANPWTDLPLLSALAGALSAGLLAFTLLETLRNRGWETRLLGLGFALAAGWSLPLLIVGTRASGLAACMALGLLVVLTRLLEREGPLPAAFLFVGLLTALHPAWGVLGLVLLLRKPWETLTRLPSRGLWILAGGLPYLWVLLRPGGALGDWGGAHCVAEMFRSWDDLLAAHRSSEIDFQQTLRLLGWGSAALAAPLFLLGWKVASGPFEALLIALAAAGAWLFHSRSGGIPGTTALWIPAGAALWWARYLSVRPGTGSGGFRFARVFPWVVMAGSLGLALLPSDRVLVNCGMAALRHAENILTDFPRDGSRTLYLAETAEAGDAVRLLWSVERPSDPSPVVLDLAQLDQRWYLEDLIRFQPEILLSVGEGSRALLFSDLVRLNLDHWNVLWGVPQWPVEWEGDEKRLGFRPLSRVLMVRLADSAAPLPPDDPSARYDLDEILLEARAGSGPAQRALDLYVEGLFTWGVGQTRVGRYPPAVRAFERSLTLQPDFEGSRVALNRLYTEKEMLEAARLQFEKTAKILPTSLQILDQALASPKTPLSKRPELLEEKGRLSTELADALRHLGVIYDKQGRYDDSRKALEGAVKWKPDEIQSRLELARLFMKVGNKVGAEASFKAVLQVDQENKEAQAELWKLLNQP